MTTATTTQPAETQAPNGDSNGNGNGQAPTGDGSELTAAFWKAVDKRSKTKGDIPAAQLTALKAAYAKTAPAKRANLVKNLNLEAADRILNDKGEFDQTIAQARKILADTIAQAREETTRTERPPHNPVPDLARALWALAEWREETLAELTDDQRKALASYKVSPTEDDTKAAKTRVDKALTSIRNSALNGRSGYSGERTSAADIAARVRKAVHEADHPLTTAELAKAADIPQATAYTRWTKTPTPGVKATKDDKGRMVFTKDTDPA